MGERQPLDSTSVFLINVAALLLWLLIHSFTALTVAYLPGNDISNGETASTLVWLSFIVLNGWMYYIVRKSNPGFVHTEAPPHTTFVQRRHPGAAVLDAVICSVKRQSLLKKAEHGQDSSCEHVHEHESSRYNNSPLPANSACTAADYVAMDVGTDWAPRCRLCYAQQLPGAKHCIYCNRCVAGWDHHCALIGCCVGAGNHSKFYLYLFTQMCTLLLTFHHALSSVGKTATPSRVHSAHTLDAAHLQAAQDVVIAAAAGAAANSTAGGPLASASTPVTNSSSLGHAVLQAVSLGGSYLLPSGTTHAVAVGIVVFLAASGTFIGGLFAFHTFLACTNQTTSSFVRKLRADATRTRQQQVAHYHRMKCMEADAVNEGRDQQEEGPAPCPYHAENGEGTSGCSTSMASSSTPGVMPFSSMLRNYVAFVRRGFSGDTWPQDGGRQHVQQIPGRGLQASNGLLRLLPCVPATTELRICACVDKACDNQYWSCC